MCKKLFKLKELDFKNGIWPFIDEFENKLKSFIIINKGSYDTVYGLFQPFHEDILLCLLLEVYDSCICTIDKEPIFTKEFDSPICCIKEEDIDNKNKKISLVSVLGETYKTSLIFCKKCNKHPCGCYTEEQFLKAGNDAKIYAHHMIKDVIMPKYLAFLFEDKMNIDGCYIDGYKTVSLIEPETIINFFAFCSK